MAEVRHGRNTQLLLQRESTYRTAPGAAAAFSMKFNPGLKIGRNPVRVQDPTVKATPMEEKTDTADAMVTGGLSSILCLNEIGQWLTLLWGAPSTTGAGPYTHVFTCDLNDRPSALMELGYLGAPADYERWLGMMVSKLSWNVIEAEQNMSLELIGAEEVEPAPTTPWDAAPTVYAKNRAQGRQGNVYDVVGASTLGDVVEASVEITNDLEGQTLADGLEGYGRVLVGQPAISGSARFILDTAEAIRDYGKNHTSLPLTLESKNAAGDASLKLILPAVEFEEMPHEIQSSKGLHIDTNWRAHSNANPPTIELVNSIPSY